MIWTLIIDLAVGTIVLKIIGPLLASGYEPPAAVSRVIGLLTPALLTSLIITSSFADGRHLTIDARAAGLVVGGLICLTRAPVVVALIAAATTTALLRALTQ
jgi:branched-subunit amino acid transport protein